MMKQNQKKISKLVIVILIVCIVIIFSYFGCIRNKKQENVSDESTSQQFEEDYENMKENSIMYQDNSTIEDLKNEYKITGKNELYEITTESDGRKMLTIKTAINYQVAFCGMIKKAKPDFKELASMYDENKVTQNGIWIYPDDRETITDYLNHNEYLKANYEINQEGYLKIVMNDEATDMDRKIEKLTSGNYQYVISINSSCYMVDVVTGEIVENPYNDIEESQTYEYFQDENKMIIFVTENEKQRVTNNEIFCSLINLLDI